MKSRREERHSRDKRNSHYKPKAYSKYENDKRHMEDLEDKERDRVGKKGHYVNQNETSSNYSSGSESDRPKLPKAYGGEKKWKKAEQRKRTPRDSFRSSSPDVKGIQNSYSRKRNEKSEKRSIHIDQQKTNSERKNVDVSPSPTRKERHSQNHTYSRSRSNSREKKSKFKDHRSSPPREVKRTKKQEEILKTRSQSDDSSRRKKSDDSRKSNHKNDRDVNSHYSSRKYKNNSHEKRDKIMDSTEVGNLSKRRTENRESDESSEYEEDVVSSYQRKTRSQSSSKSPSPERGRRKRKLSVSDYESDNSVTKLKKKKRKKRKISDKEEDTDSEEDSHRKRSMKKKLKQKGDKRKKKKDKHKKKHKDKKKKKRKEKDGRSQKIETSTKSLSSVQEKLLAIAGVDIDKSEKRKSRNRAPMSKEEYERQQSKVRRVHDSDTGRMRLVRGSGEIIEEIVSRHRHREINKQATKGDGLSFERKLGLMK